jgi:hypothetical protein
MKRSPKSTGLSSAENAEAMHSHLIVGHDIFPKIVPFIYICRYTYKDMYIYIYPMIFQLLGLLPLPLTMIFP